MHLGPAAGIRSNALSLSDAWPPSGESEDASPHNLQGGRWAFQRSDLASHAWQSQVQTHESMSPGDVYTHSA